MHPTGSSFLVCTPEAFGRPLCRLGLALRGNSALAADDVLHAIGRGVDFLNWPGHADGPAAGDAMTEAIASLGSERSKVFVCVQFASRTAADAAEELCAVLDSLRTDYVDLLTLYYVEHEDEWREITSAQGALPYLRADARCRRVGVTSHQRPLAARMAGSGLLDAVMIRYNAAHRGAEQEVFPVTSARGIPVIAYTATRWGALMRPTPDDPPGFQVPAAPDWYRFVLQNSAVAIALAAPYDRAELDAALAVLTSPPMAAEEFQRLAAHGERVRRHAGRFP